MSGRLVLDVWGGMFHDIAQNLRQLADYGVTRATAIIHDWQRSGYDNALPSHYPAQAQLGGDAGMEELVSTGTGLGYRIALHENYVNYYPNYDYFNSNDISLDSSGQFVKAWFNPGTLIQSFAERPDSMVRLASTQSPVIHQRYGTNAGYLDVNSAVAPWKNIDHRAGVQNPGMFQQFFIHAPDLWQYERDTHQGPIFGEGNNHWYWSGLLDGAEAQFGSGWPANQGLSAPLMVDFDLLKMHPLMASHGMGYYERWAIRQRRSPWPCSTNTGRRRSLTVTSRFSAPTPGQQFRWRGWSTICWDLLPDCTGPARWPRFLTRWMGIGRIPPRPPWRSSGTGCASSTATG